MPCLILGCGDLGQRLASLLLEKGEEVWGVRRSPEKLDAGIKPLAWTLPQPAPPLPPVDYIFYMLSADDFSPEAYHIAYVAGVRQLLASLNTPAAAAAARSLKRIFFISSTGVYHQNQGEEVDERSPTLPERFSGQSLLEGEAALKESPWPVTILRFSGIYGRGGPERLIEQVRAGRFPPEKPVKYSNRIHLLDGARALEHLVACDATGRTLDDCYLVSDCEPAPFYDITHWLAQQLGLNAQPGNAPPGQLQPMRGGNKRISSQRLQATGFTFLYPSYREGYSPYLD